jgi:anti-sigma28 factor (negative regulator of flagellin synthesis)|tara:strand:- start:144 stop:443 length:300 start_codon:yes stop_codon:yes gene_type:complete
MENFKERSTVKEKAEALNTDIIDGNQLVGTVIEKDPFLDVCLDAIDELPDSPNLDRILALKKQIDDGTYDFDAKLGRVVDALIEESTDPNPLSTPLFDR